MSVDYSTISIARRRTATLARLWRTLNSGDWPDEFGPKQDVTSSDLWKVMEHIACEVGRRTILSIAYTENRRTR
jgi:hypothetical protein